jgi:hypothetical protein
MTNISTLKINTKDYSIAYSELARFIGDLKSTNASYFIDELLTETETIMIVKRFAAILMFHNSFSPYRVSAVLSLSVSTAQRLQENYKLGHYRGLVSCIKKSDTDRFMSLIQDLILAQVSGKARARLLKRVL